MFVQLIGISGIGASTARMMLTSLKPEEIAKAIVQSNVKLLESVKGIGKKTAERILVELRDKIGSIQTISVDESSATSTQLDTRQEAIAALIALGYTRQVAEKTIRQVLSAEPGTTFSADALIRKALRSGIK